MIRINSNILYNHTTGEYISPSTLGIPEFQKDEDGNYLCVLHDDGNYGCSGTGAAKTVNGYKASTTSPFNFYYDTDEDGNTDIVIVNYRNITAGSNYAVQVLYDNLKIFDYYDKDTWNIQADISIKNGDITETKTETITGDIDTEATITSVTKNEYNDASVSYTPGLYTKKQVEKFLGTDLTDTDYLDSTGTGLNDAYIYTVFKVDITGECTQRFNLSMKDIFPGDFSDIGKVVGVSLGKNHEKAATKNADGTFDLGYYHVTDNDLSAITMSANDIYNNKTYAATCWVVAAYDKKSSITQIT